MSDLRRSRATAAADPPPVLTLQSACHLSSAEVGGKAAGLCALVSAGFPVPEGVVVTASAYAEVAGAAGLLDDIAPDTPRHELEARYALALDALSHTPLPEGLEPALRDAVMGLLATGGTLVVRSSATLEDSAVASFSGMLESYADIASADGVIGALRRCWASAFLPRAARYLSEKGHTPAELLVAVVVQRQIEAERSGLIFSRDPANRYSSAVIIEAIRGAGEDLVSGEATPERYRYSFASRRVTVTRMSGEGVTEGLASPLAAELGPDAEPRLAENEVARLAAWSREAEERFGVPQDIEWAYADGQFWLLQSRPLVFAQATERIFPQIAEHTVLARGIGVSPAVGAGRTLVLSRASAAPRVDGSTVVVLPRLTNDLAVHLRNAAGVVADEGGATSHGANILR